MKYQFYRYNTTISPGVNNSFLTIFQRHYATKKFLHPAHSVFVVDSIATGFDGKTQPGAIFDYFRQYHPNSYKTLDTVYPDPGSVLFIEFNTVFSLTDQQRDTLFNSNKYKIIVDDSFETNLYRAEALRETFLELYGHCPTILNNGVFKTNTVDNEIKRNHWLVLSQFAIHQIDKIPRHNHASILDYNNKKYKAICLNGHTTILRAKVLGMLARDNLITSDNTGPVLYSCRDSTHKHIFESTSGLDSQVYMPKVIENDNLKSLFEDPCLRNNPAFFWEDTFFKINIETNCFWHNDDIVMLTEKWLKSILYLKPSFTLSEQSGMDQHINQLGFNTFDEYLDRQYDSVIDVDQRMEKFISSFNSTEIPSSQEWANISNGAKENLSFLCSSFIPKLEEDLFNIIG